MTYLDTSAIIDLIEGSSITAASLTELIAEDAINTSVVAVAESLPAPLRANDQERVELFDHFFASIQLVPVSLEIGRNAANLRAKFGLKTPDAIHFATALALGSTRFITSDRHFDRVRDIFPTKVVVFSP